ncbi:MAG: hypothetical protein DIZ80_07510 [endosymbiont of Galathealinum brachiosum]|uniref:HTH luxR-type domain-containing protein n=1 Tax=endosymbiont of Galathealinum brachiosum TaxID=2200906 RepID=A0A370DGK7_9GAMM|nr:MAG: hypothetical protein DIZ80_07510 [endosymbiont of Galathealinum brachiosum]
MNDDFTPVDLNDQSDLQMSQKSTVRIYIIAEPDYAVDGMVSIIGNSGENFEVIKIASPDESSGSRCCELLKKHNVNLILMHQSAISGQASAYIKSLQAASREAKILIFGQNMPDDFLYNMLRYGVHGYINEHMKGSHLIDAIKHVMQGRVWAERHILESFAHNAIELESLIEDIIKSKIEHLGETLTARETQVLQLVLNGLATREIAHELHLSEQSVKLHLGRIFKKFEVTNRSQMILLAFERVCPVSNMIRLFRSSLDKNRISQGKTPYIVDPLISK